MVPHVLFMMLGAVFHLGITVYGEPSMKANLTSLHIISDIKYRFATTQISMKYYNPYNSAVTADLHVNMPRNSFISNFSMEIDGNVTVGEVKEKSVAKDIFEDAIQTGQSAGYIEVKHRFTNVFDISVNVEPNKDIVYHLTYQELLERQDSKYRHILHLSNGEIIDDFLVEVFITEPQDIINLSVPKIKDDKLSNIDDEGELNSTFIEYSSSREVYIKYNPSREEQEEISKTGIAGLLRVEYDVDRKNNSNLIYAVDGYFVHFFTPDYLPNLPKHIVFMLDVSGSMSGRKIDQLKEAMENILDQLDPELDKFIIGKFHSKVSWMRKNFLTATEVNKQSGKEDIKTIRATGGTNINDALLESIEVHKSVLCSTKKSIIIFLTDGEPTSGITDIESIKRNVKEANKNISLFALCFGDNCDSKFLREIATENGGFNRKIYVDSDSKLQIENLYKEISNIILKDIKLVYLNEAVNTSATSFSSYFKGSEIVVSGVLTHQNQSTMNVNLTMTDYKGPDNEILELEVYEGNFTIDDNHLQNPNFTNIQSFSEITEKTYVYLTLKQLLKEDRTTQIKQDILDLALKYNFVTPLTSMVVTKSRVKEELFEEGFPQYDPLVSQGVGPIYDVAPEWSALDHVAPDLGPIYDVAPEWSALDHVAPDLGLIYDVAPEWSALDPGSQDGVGPLTVDTVPHTSTRAPSHRTFLATTALPILPHSPAILIEPLACKSTLCFTDHIQCSNQTEIMLLADEDAKIYIRGYVEKISDTNCLETLNRVTIMKENILIGEFTPDSFTIKDKTEKITVELLPWITVNIRKSRYSETFLCLQFDVVTKFLQPKGILRDYVTDFHCTEKPQNQLVLSNKATIFNKVNYKTASGKLAQCYKI